MTDRPDREEHQVPDDLDSATPPQDTGLPDQVERDGFAPSSAEDLDEDRLRVDPLEAGMDPPERWAGADKYGTTPFEQSHQRPLAERLAEEQPDVDPAAQPVDEVPQTTDGLTVPDLPGTTEGVAMGPEDDLDAKALAEAAGRGQLADEAGGSTASAWRTPRPAE